MNKQNNEFGNIGPPSLADETKTFSQVGEFYKPWRFLPRKCLKPNRLNARRPGMLKSKRMGLL